MNVRGVRSDEDCQVWLDGVTANSNSTGHPSFFSALHLQPHSLISRHPRRRHPMPSSRAVRCCWPHSALMLRRSINFCTCKNHRVAHRIAVSCRYIWMALGNKQSCILRAHPSPHSCFLSVRHSWHFLYMKHAFGCYLACMVLYTVLFVGRGNAIQAERKHYKAFS